MNVLVNIEYDNRRVDSREIAGIAGFCMEQLDVPETSEVSITLVDNDQMHEMNREYRGIDSPTDVLSFECDNLDDSFPDEAEIAYSLGDIIIAPDVAYAQSVEYGNSIDEEMRLLTVHGILHLCGYDHLDDDDAEIMEAKQTALLRMWDERQSVGGEA